jgi:RNA 2',3'-cyclic 3'-phosphodiesterase
VRLFLALWPDAQTRASIEACQASWEWPAAAAPVAAERMHITLHFIGNVASEKLARLIAGVAVEFEPFELELTRSEVWPNTVAVLEPDRVPRELKRLHERLADALTRLELPVETRPFRPHVTLARRARGAVAPGQIGSIRWAVTQGYVLAQSLPGGGGYEILHRFGKP